MFFQNNKRFNWLFSLLVLVSGLLIPFLLPSMYIGIDRTISSIRFPNGFIVKNFNSSDPWIETSFFVKNFNNFDLNIELIISIYAQYYSKYSYSINESIIFPSHKSIFPHVKNDESYSRTLNYTSIYFNLSLLMNFYDIANFSMPYTFFMNVQFYGYYLANLMSFTVNFGAINISEYELLV